MLRSIRAIGASLLRSIKDLAGSLWYEAAVFTLALALNYLVPDTWFAPSLLGVVLLVAILLVILLLTNIRLLATQRALGSAPWSFRWSLRRCFTECIAGCLSAGLGVVGGFICSGIFGAASLTSGDYSDAALVASALAILAIFGIPGYRFWRITRRFHWLRVTEKILARLAARYDEHLSHLLPTPDVSFPVDVSLTQLAAQQSMPMAPGQPAQAPQAEEIAVPALVASLPQPAPEIPPAHVAVTHARICEFFDESHRQLVITSGSGGGKSTQLYLLAHTLLVEANATLSRMFQEAAKGMRRRNFSEMPALPIIIDLSILDIGLSVESDERVHDWQRETLVKVYGVRRRTAQRWVAQGHLTSLFDALDGLNADEHSENDHAWYFGSIHKYLSAHGNIPLVMCCGAAQYQNYQRYRNDYASWRPDDSLPNSDIQSDSLYGSQFSLPVVTLQPLSPEAVQQALGNAGSAGAIQRAIQHDRALAELLRSPMMLSLALAGASQGDSVAPSVAADGEVDWRATICHRYLIEKLSAIRGHQTWSLSQAEETLAWLGFQLQERQKHVFHLEELQFGWLPSQYSEAIYKKQIHRLRVIFTIVATLLFGIAISRTVSLVYSLGGAEFIQGTSGAGGSAGAIGDISRLIFGILGGFGVALSVGSKITKTKCIMLLKHIHPNADARWRKVPSIALLGLCALLTAAFVGGPMVVPDGALLIGLSASMVLGLLIAWCGRLATERDHFPPANRGFSNAIKSSLVLIVIFVVIGLAIGSGIAIIALSLLVGIGANLDWRFVALMLLACAGVLALTAAIFLGLSAGFSSGGASVLRHIILLRALEKSRIVPPKFKAFLESLRGTGVLRREGDGYSFVLRSAVLRDYFADDYLQPRYDQQRHRKAPETLSQRLGKWAWPVVKLFAPRRIAQAIQPRRKRRPQ